MYAAHGTRGNRHERASTRVLRCRALTDRSMSVSTGTPRDRGQKSEHLREKPRWQFWGVAAGEKRDPKSTWQSHDCCPSKSRYIIVWGYNKLPLQQPAVTAGCCCGVLLYCSDESLSEQAGYRLCPQRGISSSIMTCRVEDFDDVAQHITWSNESS